MTNSLKNKLSEDDWREYVGRWWAMRKNALDIGIIAERELLKLGEIKEADRRFYNRDEWRTLTKCV